jgi:membrane-associated phospholipid phosphatase
MTANDTTARASDPKVEGRKIDPTVSAAPAAGWQRWATELARFGQHQVAGFGVALAFGFAMGVLSLYVFAFMADQVVGQQTLQVDTAVRLWARQFASPTMEVVARAVSFMGSEAVGMVTAVMLIVLAWQRRWGAAIGLVLVVVGAQLLNDVLKELFQRTRPAPAGFSGAQQWSFPSGHAMVSAAFYSYLAYLAWRLLVGYWKALLVTALVVLVVLIGLSRIYLDVHYVSDVAAGYFAGVLWADSVIVAGHLLTRRIRRRARRAVPSPVT